MEHSRIDAVELIEPGSPFHHLALPLERAPLRFTLRMDGRWLHGRNAADTVVMIEAGAAGMSHWDAAFESACLYFTNDALAHALGIEEAEVRHTIRTQTGYHSPELARLQHALYLDAATGQRHGTLIGDAIFVALAAHVVPQRKQITLRHNGESWRVRNALGFIHAYLTEKLSIAAIAEAAGTSPYYLSHVFRDAIGCSIWQYVLRERARYAVFLMRNPQLTLTSVAQVSGFDTYASFIAAVRREYGQTPAALR